MAIRKVKTTTKRSKECINLIYQYAELSDKIEYADNLDDKIKYALARNELVLKGFELPYEQKHQFINDIMRISPRVALVYLES